MLECAWANHLLGPDFVLGLGGDRNISQLAKSVLSGSRHIELQTVAVEDLVEGASGRGLVEADVLARKHLVVRGSLFARPLGPRVSDVVLHFVVGREHVFLSFVERVLKLLVLGATSVVLLPAEEADVWVIVF